MDQYQFKMKWYPENNILKQISKGGWEILNFIMVETDIYLRDGIIK